MKLRFSIRDLLWLAVVVALVVTLVLSQRDVNREKEKAARLASVFLPDKPHFKYIYKFDSNVVYRVGYPEGTGGGIAAAYRLSDGEQLWQSKLQGIGLVAHFAYSNEVSIVDVSEGLPGVVIEGHELAGSYVEILDRKTGKLISNRPSKKNFPKREDYQLE